MNDINAQILYNSTPPGRSQTTSSPDDERINLLTKGNRMLMSPEATAEMNKDCERHF